jgi:hypothetical protein
MLLGELGDGVVRGMPTLSRELRWNDPDRGRSQAEPDIQSEPEASTEDEARDGSGDPTSTALSVVERAGGSSTGPANELLRAVSAFTETLKSERQTYRAAQEELRKTEVENARLRAEMEFEQEQRRQAESQLKELRADVVRKQRRAEKELERISTAWDPHEGRSGVSDQSTRLASEALTEGTRRAGHEAESSLAEAQVQHLLDLVLTLENRLRHGTSREHTILEQSRREAPQHPPAPPPVRATSARPEEAASSARRAFPTYIVLSFAAFVVAVVIGLFAARLAG